MCFAENAPPLKGKVRCAECTEKNKATQKEWAKRNKEKRNEYYRQDIETFKKTHTCMKCRCRETYFGHLYCPECLEKRREYQRKPNIAEKQRQTKKARKERLLQAGLCVYCGKEPALDGLLCCEKCRKRINNNTKRNRQKRKEANGYIPRENYGDYGMCEICKAPVKEGYRVCEKHYQHLCKISVMDTPAKRKAQQEWRDKFTYGERKADKE
ncbi:MAG: hypothetical protein LUD27_01900 [Clostridia bacterium]|nr:hypothetical protein [Clostridia bacterium]